MARVQRKTITSDTLESVSDYLLAALNELHLGVANEAGDSAGRSLDAENTASDPAERLPLMARALYRQRRQRALEFDDDLFGEPAWDILLDAYIQESAGREVSVSSACIASCVPNTTALRHISHLVARGLLVRRQSGHDRRLVYLSLSERGRSAISAHLLRVAQLGRE